MRIHFFGKKAQACLLAPILLLLGTAPVHAQSFVEGDLPSEETGYYDLSIEVWDTQGKLAPPGRVIQKIHVPKVRVTQGSFSVALEVDWDLIPWDGISLQVSARSFETGNPFQPVTLSKVITGSEPQSAVVNRTPHLVPNPLDEPKSAKSRRKPGKKKSRTT